MWECRQGSAATLLRAARVTMSTTGELAGARSGNPAEDRTRHEAGAAGVVEVKDAPDHLAGREKSVNGFAFGVDHLRLRVHLDPAERKGNTAGDRIGLEGRFVD